MRHILPTALLIFFSEPAFAKSAEPVARIGQTVIVDGPRVRPLAVLEDSRCLANAVCVWSGQLRLRVRVSGGRWSVIKELTLGTPVPFADGALTLVGVTPGRSVGRTIKTSAYRFVFRFEGGL
jgi:hypothetical protein